MGDQIGAVCFVVGGIMARLHDKIMAGHGGYPDWFPRKYKNDGWYNQFISRLRAAPVIVVDNVTKYYMETSPKNAWMFHEFPNVAPPFDCFWIESSTHNYINVDGEVSMVAPKDRIVKRFGFLCVANVREATGWRIQAALFVETRVGVIGPMGELVCDVSHEGTVMESTRQHGKVPVLVNYADNLNEIRRRHVVDLTIGQWKPMMLALSFMHCRNVEMRRMEQPLKLSKKWERKTGRPLVNYHILDVDPMKATLESEGGVNENGLKKALHICRGHFATYTKDAPLFGNYVGSVWRNAHVRGSLAAGVTEKSYNVKSAT